MNTFFARLALSLLLVASFSLSARSVAPAATSPEGITFFRGSWKDVLAEARRQNKPIFLDIYTTWCPPCRRMAREAFPSPVLGTKFNTHFINYQLDAEKGEGLAIAKQYAVASYPTGLYLSPTGALVHRSVGYGGVKAMVDLADHVLALSPMKPTLAKGDKEYAKGRRDAAFLKKYLKTRQELNRPLSDVLDAYLDALSEAERSQPESIAFTAEMIQSSTSKAFDFLIRRRLYLPSDLLTVVTEAQQRMISRDFNRAVTTRDQVLLEQIITNNERLLTAIDPNRSEEQKQTTAATYRQSFLQEQNIVTDSAR